MPNFRTLHPSLRWIGAVAITLIAAAAVVLLLIARGSQGTDISDAQWSRLIRQMTVRAATVEDAASAAAPGQTPAQSAGTLPTPEGGAASADGVDAGSSPPAPPASGAAPSHQRLPLVPDPEVRGRQAVEYAADSPKTIIELQQFRDAARIDISDGGQRQGTATLINLNPQINAWYLLRLQWNGEPEVQSYHLANSSPAGQSFVLHPDFRQGLMIASTGGGTPCDLWSFDNPQRLEVAAARNTPYVLLCDEQVTLRLRTTGRRTATERVTDFLRDTVWGGEAITVFVRETFFRDAFLSTAELAGPADGDPASQREARSPPAARLDERGAGQVLDRSELGLAVDTGRSGRAVVGEWYPLRDNPGAFASTLRPDLIAPDILASHTDYVIGLDEVEKQALTYLVAFDLDRFDVAFSLGTDHPRLGWSDRVPEERRDATLPGPDGIAVADPLVRTGIIPGALAGRSVATFTGGFKRTHGGFLYGELAQVNHGSHYGLIEEGVIFSKLQPGLATIYVLDDGTFEMKTWTAADNALLERVRYARQNGVPVIERSTTGGAGVPGAMVSRYGAGNWSGSQDGKYRTLRAGACLQETNERRFLIYAYFSSATPSAMARVFQAYGCTYAMLLDMNALEHTYLAVYSVRGSELVVQHLVRGMEVLDKSEGDVLLPRFLGFSDNRDFFYLLRRDPARAATVTGETGAPGETGETGKGVETGETGS